MKFNRRGYLFVMITVLCFLLIIWTDDVYFKTNSINLILSYQLVKIVLHSFIAYRIAKYLCKKLSSVGKLNEVNHNTYFLILFVLFNSYILIQYSYRVISFKIVNAELRGSIADKLIKTKTIGTGYEGQNLSYKEYQEIIRFTNLPDIPEVSTDIYIYDWYEFDFSRIVEFNVPRNYKIDYSSKFEEQVEKNVPSTFYTFAHNGEMTYQEQDSIIWEWKAANKIDKSNFRRFKWEASSSK